MNGLLNGWHRKAAFSLLLLAIMVTGVWVRSQCTYDVLYFTIGIRSHYVTSSNGALNWRSWDGVTVKQPFWKSDSSFSVPEQIATRQLEYYRARAAATRPAAAAWAVPYWGIVATLSLMSILVFRSQPIRSKARLELTQCPSINRK